MHGMSFPAFYSYGRIVAVVYMVKPDGSMENFNRKLVDYASRLRWEAK